MGDVVGRLFHEFAITLAITIVISAVVSLTLVPMMCARLIRHRPEAERSGFDLRAEHAFNAIIGGYGRALNWVLDRQPLTLLVAVLTLVFTLVLYYEIPKGFFPVQDTGLIQAITEASQSVSYQEMATLQNRLAEAVLKDPDVVNLSSYVGVDGTNRDAQYRPVSDHAQALMTSAACSASAIIAAAAARGRRRDRHHALHAAGAGPDHRFDDQSRALQFRARRRQLRRNSTPGCRSWWHRLNQLPQLTGVASDLQQQGLAVDLVIDRATASRFGITPATVDNALYDAFGQRIVSTIYTQSNQYRVILELDPTLQRSLDGLSSDLSAVIVVGDQRPGAAFGHHPHRAENRPAGDHPLRPVPRHDDFVQHRARLLDRFRRSPPSSRRRPISACPRASSPRSRAPRRRFSPR